MIVRHRDGVPWARVSRVLPLDADRAWRLVADVRRHGRWVPLTRVDLGRPRADGSGWERRPDGSAPRVGDRILAVSGPCARRGGPGLVDRMRIERFDAPLGRGPGTAVFVKLGPVLLGGARIEVADAGAGSSRVTWSEAVHLRGLPPATTRWVGAALTDLMVRGVLRRVAREAERLAQRNIA